MNRKRMVLSAVLAFSILGPVTAYAASGSAGTASASSAAVSQSQNQQGGLSGTAASESANESGAHHGKHGHGQGLGLKTVASVIGVDVTTLKSDLAAGKTLAQIAQAKGMDESTLISKLRTAKKEKLNALVQSGKITATEEQTQLTNFDAHAKQFVESKHMGHGHPDFGKMRGSIIKNSAAALGMTPEALVAELRTGKSIVDVAQSKGVSERDLTAKLTTNVQAKLDKAVANGKITQAHADKAIGSFKSHISTVLNRKGGPWMMAKHSGQTSQGGQAS